MPDNRRLYSEEFKREAVRLAEERGNLRAVARELGVNETILQRWKKALADTPANPFPGQGNPSDPERVRLEREIARLREENEILKKAMSIFTVRSR
jgi:transposase